MIVRQYNGQEQVEGLGIFLNLPIKNSVNITEIDNSISIFQLDGVNEFITINFMPNSLVDCQMVFLNKSMLYSPLIVIFSSR